MKTIAAFIKGTRKISRILFVIWIFFGTAGAGFDASQFIYSFPATAIFFLLPAFFIERAQNPVWVSLRNQNKIKKLEQQIAINTQRKQDAIQIQQLQEYNAQLKRDIEKEMIKTATSYGAGSEYTPNENGEYHITQNSGQEQVSNPQNSPQLSTADNLNCQSNKKSIPLYQRVFGVIFMVFGGLFVFSAILGMSVNYEEKLWFLLFAGIVFAILGLLFVSGTIFNKERQNNSEYGRSEFANYYEVECYDVSEIDGMDGHEFEYFCADILSKNGFSDVSVTKGSGDQGVDILATKDGMKYAIQCKNYASPLSNKPIQEVSAGKIFYNCHIGAVLTNSTFTSGAISLANATGVLLWDRKFLAELIKVAQPNVQKYKNDCDSVTTYTANHAETRPNHFGATNEVSGSAHETKSVCNKTPVHPNSITIDNIVIEIDHSSFNHYKIELDDFGLEMDEEDEDDIELLFDVIAKGGRGILHDIDIVCNLYSNSRKLATERVAVYQGKFQNRDSLSVYFNKKGICKKATKIEIFCQEW